jgi:hypothetical protein
VDLINFIFIEIERGKSWRLPSYSINKTRQYDSRQYGVTLCKVGFKLAIIHLSRQSKSFTSQLSVITPQLPLYNQPMYADAAADPMLFHAMLLAGIPFS